MIPCVPIIILMHIAEKNRRIKNLWSIFKKSTVYIAAKTWLRIVEKNRNVSIYSYQHCASSSIQGIASPQPPSVRPAESSSILFSTTSTVISATIPISVCVYRLENNDILITTIFMTHVSRVWEFFFQTWITYAFDYYLKRALPLTFSDNSIRFFINNK